MDSKDFTNQPYVTKLHSLYLVKYYKVHFRERLEQLHGFALASELKPTLRHRQVLHEPYSPKMHLKKKERKKRIAIINKLCIIDNGYQSSSVA